VYIPSPAADCFTTARGSDLFQLLGEEQREILKTKCNITQELGGRSTIQCAVVVSQGETHCLIALELAIDHANFGHKGIYAEDTGLRRIDNRGEALDAERTNVGDGEGCTGEEIGADVAGFALCSESLSFSGDLSKRLLVCIAVVTNRFLT